MSFWNSRTKVEKEVCNKMVDGIEKDKKEKPSVLYKSCNSTGNDNVKLRKIQRRKIT